MKLDAIRMRKEARQMFWPWAVVTGAGALALLLGSSWQPAWLANRPGWLDEGLFLFISVAGIPLLASLPLGYEFQYRTMPMLLAGPVERKQIWREKMAITLAAIVVPLILFLLNARQYQFEDLVSRLALAMIIAMSASALYWTLRARATLGGLALNNSVFWMMFLAWSYFTGNVELDGAVPPLIAHLTTVLLLGYGAGMVWLGRRELLRFQAIDGSPAGDPLEALTERMSPRFLGDWLVSRPNTSVLNLVRRELRLLRPVWPLAILMILAWSLLVALGALPLLGQGGRTPASHAATIAVVLISCLSPLLAILAGTLSLGEDKLYGTHEWHMTLPISTRLQWSIKLMVAVLTSAVCAVLAPVLVVSVPAILGRPGARFIEAEAVWAWLLAASLVTLVSFWLACAVKGTVRAALCVIPAFLGLGLAIQFGAWLSQRFTAAAGSLIDQLLFRVDPFWMTRTVSLVADFQLVKAMVLAAVLPAAAFVILHSYRLFRGQAEDTSRHLARSFLPVAMVVFLCAFAVWSLLGFWQRGEAQIATLFRETHVAIARRQAAGWDGRGGQPLRLTVAQLAEAARLSDSTRHWLGNATITVVPEKRASFCCGYSFAVSDPANRQVASYSAVIPLSNGSACSLSFFTAGTDYGIVGGTC